MSVCKLINGKLGGQGLTGFTRSCTFLASRAVKFGLAALGIAGALLTLTTSAAAAPPVPADVFVSGVDSTQVTLSWNASSGATSYNVKRSTVSGGPYTTVATGVAATTYTNTGLSNNGTVYYFVVTAKNSSGTSANSNEPYVVTPNPSSKTAISATATVNWGSSAGTTTSALFGTNDLETTWAPGGAQDAAYTSDLSQIGINTFRLHDGGLSGYVANGGWTNTNKTWDSPSVAAEYAAPYLQGATTIQTIPYTPPWMAAPATVNPSTYGAFCAQLVGIVKTLPGTHATYWEPMNEWNDGTVSNTQLNNVFNACATAMKAADPAIKMAGPVPSWCDTSIIGPFLQSCGANVDMVSWHRYGDCGATDSTDDVMNGTPAFGTDVTAVRSLIAQYVTGHSVKTAVDEYNIPCAWNEGETRQFSNVGAAFNASVLKNLAYAGCDIATTWGSKDDSTYGMIAGDDTMPYPVSTMHKWALQYLVGTLASTTSTNGMVEAMAVRKADNSQTVLLINKSSGTATVTLNLGLGTSNVNIGSIDALGIHAIVPATLPGAVAMPPCSVEIIQVPATSSAPPAPTGLTATAGNAQVGLAWNASSGATSYSVYRGTASGAESTTAIVSGLTGTTYTNTGLTNGTTYFYKVKATNSFGTSGYSNEASAIPAAGGGGSLTGSVASASGTINLTTLGTTDWAHWGTTSATSFDHKSSGGAQISNFTKVGSPAVVQYADDTVGFTWTGGTPTASATNSTTGIYVAGVNTGYSFTVPADTTSRTLKIYCGGWMSAGSLTAHLSDGSATDYAGSGSSTTNTYDKVFTVTYKAASAGKTLTITWKETNDYSAPNGNITLQSATLQ